MIAEYLKGSFWVFPEFDDSNRAKDSWKDQ